MCDCYAHKCKECELMLPLHLGDFDTERSEIEVFCEKHLPEEQSDGWLWEWCDEEGDYPKWSKMFIKWLTLNAKANANENCPNTSYARRFEDKGND